MTQALPSAAEVPQDQIEKDDLRLLLIGADNTATIKDREGKIHSLTPLRLRDLLEVEDRTGVSIFDSIRTTKLRDVAFMVWIALRKNGLSPEEIKARKWKLDENECYEMFDAAFFSQWSQIFLDLLKLSGFKPKKVDADPTKGGSPTHQ